MYWPLIKTDGNDFSKRNLFAGRTLQREGVLSSETKSSFFSKLALQSCCHVFTASRSCSIMHLRDPIEILSSLLFHSPEQNEHSHSPFNSVMPDNIQFIYGELIKTRGGGLLVCALIYLNQQTVYCALM